MKLYNFRTALLRFIGLLALCGLFIYLVFWLGFSCEHTIISTTPGPNSLEADIIAELCSDETIQIYVKNKNTSEKRLVFTYTPMNSDPEVKWLDKTTLDITIRNARHIDFQVTQLDDIKILYHIEPALP